MGVPGEGTNRVVLTGLALILGVIIPATFLYEAAQQLVVVGPGYLNAKGTGVGSDFVAFYSGAQLALQGETARAYDVAHLQLVQQAIIGGGDVVTPWAYPPHYFLFVLPFAMLPYLPALWLWIGLTSAALLAAAHALVPRRHSLLLVGTYPAVLLSVLIGQNGALTAALLAGGLALLPRRPAAAGLLFGLVLYKPHLAVVLPVCLLAAREFRAFGVMAATGLGLAALSVAVFGIETWAAFFGHLPAHFAYAQSGAIHWDAMPTVFIALLRLTGSPAWAEAAQGVALIGATLCVALVWARTSDIGPRSLALGAVILLSTPFALTYDMTVLTIACAVYGHRYLEVDRSPRTLAIALVIWFAPLLTRLVYKHADQQIGPVLLVGLLAVAVASCRRTAPRASPATAAGVA
jgi:hypothetical protein